MKPEKKQQARDLYLHAGLSQTEIANILSIDRKTVYLWMREGQWDKMKAAARQAPSAIQQDLYNHIETINQNIFDREDAMPTLQEVEMLRKLTAMTKSMERQHSGSYMQAFQDLCTFIYKKEPNLARQVMPYADKYIKGTFNKKKMTSEECEEIMQAIKENEQREQELIAHNTATEQEMSNAQPPANPETPLSNSVPTGNNGENQNPPTDTPKPATDKHFTENDHQNNNEKFPKSDTTNNEENIKPNDPNPPKKE